MIGKMTVLVEKELMLMMAEEMYNHLRAKIVLRTMAYAFFTPILAWELLVLYVEGFTILHAGAVCLCAWMIWFCRFNHKKLYMRGWEKKVKNFLPVEETVEFNEVEIKKSSKLSMISVLWKDIDIVCENENYWFFIASQNIIVDKKQLNANEYQFLLEKSKEISSKKRKL